MAGYSARCGCGWVWCSASERRVRDAGAKHQGECTRTVRVSFSENVYPADYYEVEQEESNRGVEGE